MKMLIVVLVVLGMIALNVEGYVSKDTSRRYSILQKALNNDNFDSNSIEPISLNNDNFDSNSIEPMTIRSSLSKPVALGLGWLTIAGGVLATNMLTTTIARAKTGGKFPIIGSSDIMSKKAHGTSEFPVQSKLRWNCDVKLADRICNYNRQYAEFAGYWNSETSFLKENDGSNPITFYDSVTGVALFRAPVGRTWEEFVVESRGHGWPSFRDDEVVWENVRSLNDGEMVSSTGTHLGHNLPDRNGNRYCINLVSVAGFPTTST